MTRTERERLMFRCDVLGIKYEQDEGGQVMIYGSYKHLGEERPNEQG